jgi:hypothetical protein
MLNILTITSMLIVIASSNLYSEEYNVTFKNSLLLYWGGDPACDCPLPEEAIFIEKYTNREIEVADDNYIIKRYYTLQKSFQDEDGRSGKDIWKLKSKYRNKIFRIVVKYDRCLESYRDAYSNCDNFYNNQLKSIYPID